MVARNAREYEQTVRGPAVCPVWRQCDSVTVHRNSCHVSSLRRGLLHMAAMWRRRARSCRTRASWRRCGRSCRRRWPGGGGRRRAKGRPPRRRGRRGTWSARTSLCGSLERQASLPVRLPWQARRSNRKEKGTSRTGVVDRARGPAPGSWENRPPAA
eukprot:917404-Prorocentrum_minimum.AAC.1